MVTTGTDALTTNISAEPIVNGAFIGAGVVLGVGVIAASGILAAPVAGAAACADGDCTNEARALVALGDDALESQQAQSLIQKIVTTSTKNPNSSIVSLGRFKNITENYKLVGNGQLTYFDLGDDVYKILQNGQSTGLSPYSTAVNSQFMTNQINLGKDFGLNYFGFGIGHGNGTRLEYNMLINSNKYVQTLKEGFEDFFAYIR